MGSKVIHISDVLWFKLAQYCASENIRTSIWVDQVLNLAVDSAATPIVARRDISKFSDVIDEDVWKHLPFWRSKK